MDVLGISCYFHDSAACLLRDGIPIAAAQEERFSRKKHDNGFPFKAIEFVLKQGSTDITKIDAVTFYEKPVIKFERAMQSFVETFPYSHKSFVKSMPAWFNEKLQIRRTVRKMGYKGKVCFVDHHLAHAASSFLCSPFDSSAIVTIDGVGEWATTTIGYGNLNEVYITEQISFPHSIGLFYSAFTAFLGFKINNDEYKVMGLASYGDAEKYYGKVKKTVRQFDDGSYALDMSYFAHHIGERSYSNKLVEEFGEPRKPESEITQYHKDLSAALQKVTEELVLGTIKHALVKFPSENVCLAGGVALNCVANSRVINDLDVKLFIQPAAGDDGASLGSALYFYYCAMRNTRNRGSFVMEHAYLGPDFATREIHSFLRANGVKYSEIGFENVPKTTARLVREGNIVGWFQGKMEWGPRALGSRSILADPTDPKMKDKLNDKVKHREDFRPFAPVSTIEDAGKYFEIIQNDPFMLLICNVKEDARKKIPSVTHFDGTARLQTVERKNNALYYDVVKEFGKLSGVDVLINTSFNIRGEPIVCTPQDAFKCMMGTGIDVLVMGDVIVWKKDNMEKAWDSQNIVKNDVAKED